MMAGTGVDIGGLKGSEAEKELSSHQDLDLVGADCGGTRTECKGNANVLNDLGGSYIFVSGDRHESIVDENGKTELRPGVDLKEDSVVKVKNGEAVDETGGEDEASVVEDNKEVALNGECFAENGKPDCEVKVEDQVESEFISKPIRNPEFQTNNDGLLGDSQVVMIELGQTGELLGKSAETVEKNFVVPPEDLVENQKADAVVMRVDGCGLPKVDVGEGQVKQTELKLLEANSESEIRITSFVDSVSHEDEKDGTKLNDMNDLGNDAEPGESQETVIKIAEAGELSDKSVSVVVEQDVIVSSADFGVNEPSDTVSEVDECELPKAEAAIEINVEEGKSMGQAELMSVEKSLESQITTTESVSWVSPELEDSENLKNIKDINSDTEGEFQLGNEVDAIAHNGILCTAVGNDYKVSKEKEPDMCIDEKQSFNEQDSTPSKATTFASMEKLPSECGENHTACTDDGAAVKHEPSISAVVQVNGAVNLVNIDSDRSTMSVELIKPVPAKICGNFLASIDNGPVSYQGPVNDECRVDLVQGGEAERVAGGTDGMPTNETAQRPVSDQTNTLQTNLEERMGGCTNSPELKRKSDDAQSNCIEWQVQDDTSFQSNSNGGIIVETEINCPSSPVAAYDSKSVSKNLDTEDVGSELLSATDSTKSESEVACGLSSCSPNNVKSGIKIEFGTLDSAVLVSNSCGGDVLFESQVSNGDTEYAWKQAISTTNSIESKMGAHMDFQSEVQYSSDMLGKHCTVAEPEVLRESAVKGGAALPECSFGDSVEGQNLVVVAKVKPFQFLVKIPRFDDDKLQQRIKDAQMLVEAKTVLRNDIRCEIEMKRANLKLLNDKFEDTRSDERAARRMLKLKRQEIDSVQAGISRVMNSISVRDITNRIAQMEYMIEHETNALKEEKQLLHEINQLKKLREQISSNVCAPEEVANASNHLELMEMQLKTLKKELGDLKTKVSEAGAACILLGKEYNGESKRLKELQGQFRVANDVRQDAYKNFLDLKRQLHEKSKHYWMYKDDAKAASDYALNRDREALYHLCANQVETFMDVWIRNNEFREDYVRCNMKSTLRRFKTTDGRSLGLDEVPLSPLNVNQREGMQLSSPAKTAYPSSAAILKQENKVQLNQSESVDGVVADPKSEILKTKTSVKTIPGMGFNFEFVELEAGETKAEEKQETEEELETARKAEMLRKEEMAAMLKEQTRQEERAKAQEALERKKRSAEKAQMRAVLRAQKEAEQKEKERERRMRKKEKKNGDGEAGLELETDSAKDGSKEDQERKPKKTAHLNKHSKQKVTMPPALRNRGKRRLKQLMWWVFGGLIVFLIFLVGNAGPYGNLNLKSHKGDKFFGNNWQPI